MRRSVGSAKALAIACVAGLVLWRPCAWAEDSRVTYLDQGAAWTAATRNRFYSQDQGSELIPLAWLKALRQSDGAPFLPDAFARSGYLPNPDPANSARLPVGFTLAQSAQGPMVGMTCSACHTRQITVDQKAYRIDGAPAIADFGAMVVALDAAVQRVLADPSTFRTFADAVLGVPTDETARDILHAEVELWWVRYHVLIGRSVPTVRPWGPTRLDAIAMIYNRLSGLDIGPAPTYLIPENVQVGDGPTRYPFLWNAPRQDITQWTGVAENGNAVLALARSLSEIYGVFGRFHPKPNSMPMAPLDRDYLAENSTYFAGLGALEGLLDRLGPPKWPWPIDRALAKKGAAIFDRPIAQGGCVACHGLKKGVPRLPNFDTWKTPLVDVGTDTRAWQVLLRSVKTGGMEGASLPGAVAPLRATDLSLNLLKLSVLGTIVDYQAAGASAPSKNAAAEANRMPSAQMDGAMKVAQNPAKAPIVNVYEARVLRGVWAAAPFLHNGSVPTLADLLKPAAQRPQGFKIGSAYDVTRVGLAVEQPGANFTLRTTDCSERNSGDSRCGHEYGTSLSEDDRAALIEYLKTL